MENKTLKYKEIDISNKKPYVSINNYQCFYRDLPEDFNDGVAGFIINPDNQELRIQIIVDDEWVHDLHYENMCFQFSQDDYIRDCHIIMTLKYFHKLRENDYMQAGIWHEIGHFHTMHYFRYVTDGNSQNTYRMDLIEKGIVPDYEQAADLFAAYYTTPETVLTFLTRAIRERLKLINDDNRFDAANEMRARKAIIKEISSEEDIRERLCSLCKVDNFEII